MEEPKIEIKYSRLIEMNDEERIKFFENHSEQVANALKIVNYLAETKNTKVWYEQVGYLMENFTIKNKI
jgi:hypothetical protein